MKVLVPRRELGDLGNSAILGLLIGFTVFVGSFVYVVDVAMDSQGDTGGVDEARFSTVAKSLSDILMAPGKGWLGDPSVADGAPDPTHPDSLCPDYDDVTRSADRIDGDGIDDEAGRFGLGADKCDPGRQSGIANQLSFWKFQNLYNAKDERADNEKVDYESARASLDLDDAQVGFHIRSAPVLASTRELLRTERQDPDMRPMYIGNYQRVSSGPSGGAADLEVDFDEIEPSGTCTDRIEVGVTITNDGSTSTIFVVDFDVMVKKGMDFQLHTPLLAPGASYDVKATILKSKDWDWHPARDPEIQFEISDTSGEELGSGEIDLSTINMADTNCIGGVTGADSTNVNVFIRSGATSYDSSSGSATFTATAQAFKGTGDSATTSNWKCGLGLGLDPASYTYTEPLSSSSDTDFCSTSITANPANVPYTYTIDLTNSAGTSVWNSDIINLFPGEEAPYTTAEVTGNYQASTTLKRETKFLDLLIEQFDRAVAADGFAVTDIPVQLPTAVERLHGDPGDILPATKKGNEILEEFLEDENGDPTTALYSTLIIGSDVDQTVLNDDIKWVVRDWVKAGGTLIVMGGGGDKEHNNWLNPVYSATEDTASTGLFTPDEDHPLLNTPNDLDYTSYDSSYEWDVGDPDFTPIVQTNTGDILTVGNAGSLERGRVILSGWQPATLTGDADSACIDAELDQDTTCEGLFLFHNLVSFTYRDLYLDYGPALPIGEAVGSQIRLGTVYHPEVKKTFAVEIQVYTFPQG